MLIESICIDYCIGTTILLFLQYVFDDLSWIRIGDHRINITEIVSRYRRSLDTDVKNE